MSLLEPLTRFIYNRTGIYTCYHPRVRSISEFRFLISGLEPSQTPDEEFGVRFWLEAALTGVADFSPGWRAEFCPPLGLTTVLSFALEPPYTKLHTTTCSNFHSSCILLEKEEQANKGYHKAWSDNCGKYLNWASCCKYTTNSASNDMAIRATKGHA